MPEIVEKQSQSLTVFVYIAFVVGVFVIVTSPFFLAYYLFRRKRSQRVLGKV